MIAAKVALEITDENYYVFHRAFTPCIQEYIEARTFLEYMQTKSLLTLESLQSEIHTACEDKSTAKLNVDTDDYVLGVADLTGELMRRAISIASEAEKICEFLVRIESSIAEIVEMGAGRREGNKKVSVLRQSVQKVEKACFDAAVQSAEVIGAE